MAEIVTGIKFKVIKLNLIELQAVEGGYAIGICDSCGKPSFDGYYIAVLNSYYCPECFESWLRRATYFSEDKPIEDRNFNYWKQQLEKVGNL